MPTNEIIEAHKRRFIGKKLENIIWNDPYVRYVFEGGGYFEEYQHLGELNWIAVENGLPQNKPVDPGTETVLIKTNREYLPDITTATGEYTEDGFKWFPDNSTVLEPVWGGKRELKVTHWAYISLPIDNLMRRISGISGGPNNGQTNCSAYRTSLENRRPEDHTEFST